MLTMWNSTSVDRFNVVGQWASTCSVSFALSQMLGGMVLLGTGGANGGGYVMNKYEVVATNAAILFSSGLLNCLPIKYVDYLGLLSAAWNFLGTKTFAISSQFGRICRYFLLLFSFSNCHEFIRYVCQFIPLMWTWMCPYLKWLTQCMPDRDIFVDHTHPCGCEGATDIRLRLHLIPCACRPEPPQSPLRLPSRPPHESIRHHWLRCVCPYGNKSATDSANLFEHLILSISTSTLWFSQIIWCKQIT